MESPPPGLRWRFTRPSLLSAVQFAAVITLLYYIAPVGSTKSLTDGVIVFLVALIVALFFAWPS